MNSFDLHFQQAAYQSSRRQFLDRSAAGLGGLALGSLLGQNALGANIGSPTRFPTHTAKAKRVIYLFQSGGPPHMDLFDYKPHLDKVHGEEVPDSVFNGQRLTGMTAWADFISCRAFDL